MNNDDFNVFTYVCVCVFVMMILMKYHHHCISTKIKASMQLNVYKN